VIISNRVITETYIAAYAIRIFSYELITKVEYDQNKISKENLTDTNYPNPFNTNTKISYYILRLFVTNKLRLSQLNIRFANT